MLLLTISCKSTTPLFEDFVKPLAKHNHSETARWAEAYLPYLIVFTTGYLTQLSLYWILGTFSVDVKASARTGGLFRAFETAGQAVSYAINSNDGGDNRIPFYVNCALLVASIPCMVSLIGLVPEQPASTDIDAGVYTPGDLEGDGTKSS